MLRNLNIYFLLFFILIIFPVNSSAHPGGLNSEGCHMNRKTGEYHCHGSARSSSNMNKEKNNISLENDFSPSANKLFSSDSNKINPKIDNGKLSQYSGNVNSMKFHSPGCRYYNCKNCTEFFSSRDEAIDSGYKPCKVCN